MKLDGIAISGFRSFGDRLVKIKDLQKINIFIGKNNCGKSNVLRFVKHLSEIETQKQYKGFDQDLDFSVDSQTKDIQFGYQIKRNSPATGPLYQSIQDLFPKWSEYFPDWDQSFWFIFSVKDLSKIENQPFVKTLGEHIVESCPRDVIDSLTGKFFNYTQSNLEKSGIDIATRLLQMAKISFVAYLIGAFRQITPSDREESGLGGKGLVRRLRQLQSPKLNSYKVDKRKFLKINTFVEELLGEQDAFLEIPAEEDNIYVSIRKRILPLHSLGTGIHELIILAASVTVYDNVVFCIEEPEIHLHPNLQKKFIKYIRDKTSNQYFITTHSNSCFDLEDVNIYHCRLKGKCTECNLTTTRLQKSTILSDLGYKASDILQSNYLIWVEGPSDRIYLNHWIKRKRPNLVEGLHYSIMFYGGRLLSHLAFDDPEIEEFIQLCRLNRNACILIDSDKKSSHAWPNETKRRIIKDFNDNEAFAWVTNGRTIENYVPEELFNAAIEAVHPKTKGVFDWARFNDLTKLRKDKTIDKVRIAKKLSSFTADFSMLDLEEQIDKLVNEIKKSNS